MKTILTTTDPQRLGSLNQHFEAVFGQMPHRIFSAPGRTEICGNHTDHQRGRVLAAAVNLDALAAVSENNTMLLRVQSEGYPMYQVELSDLSIHKDEENTTPALIRGVAARFHEMGCPLRGLDIYVTSQVLPGPGLSSSAALRC